MPQVNNLILLVFPEKAELLNLFVGSEGPNSI